MECYCEPTEGEPCDLWSSSWRKARKPHKCGECREEIKPGERYRYTFILFEGDASDFKECAFCAGERDRIMLDYSEEFAGLVPGELACALVWELRERSPQ